MSDLCFCGKNNSSGSQGMCLEHHNMWIKLKTGDPYLEFDFFKTTMLEGNGRNFEQKDKLESEDLGMGFLWAIQEGFKGNKILPFLQKNAQRKIKVTVEVIE